MRARKSEKCADEEAVARTRLLGVRAVSELSRKWACGNEVSATATSGKFSLARTPLSPVGLD
jgi:hypothetical protein